ncbi:hypothetical protein [Herbaspirillum sp. RV1423]|uniref:hypothetical protein n=1 Tax=Herbaspirillum sp. RV1423 TaxID=1443993 RepID=UPI0012DF1BEB|nr:hypothetical protein [Herbaspirillum sp. RV1423]
MTINRITEPHIWNRFDEKNYLDFCPSVATLPNGEQWVAFRRNKRPPVWGAGEIWMVRVDQELAPIGTPFQLIPAGEDPRLLVLGNRLFLMYVYVDRSDQGEIVGTTIAIAKIDWANGFQLIHHLKLPQNPLGSGKKPDNSLVGYEKNWVPFFIDSDTIGILYSHSPWIVLELSVAGAPGSWSFKNAHQDNGLEWGYGEIRGGSVPIEYSPNEYITFFHSSAKTGGKKIYYGGACIFSKHAPYTPTYFTAEPLTTSPFKSGSDKHGWYLGQPIIFPLGASFNARKDSYEILCSLDDAFICLYSIPSTYLRERLQAAGKDHLVPRILSYRKKKPDDKDLFVISAKRRIPFQEELIRFFNAMEISGDIYFDIGADDGDFLVLLNNQFRQSYSVAPTSDSQASRQRNIQLNAMHSITSIDEAQFPSFIAAMTSDMPIKTGDEIWMRIDCAETHASLDTYIPVALQMSASLLLSGISQDAMRALLAQYDMNGYAISVIASLNQVMYLLIEKSHVKKYEWFI